MERTDLSGNELEVLRILWERNALKPAEIQDVFSWPIENATLRSILVNLVEKGHLSRSRHGKAFRYDVSVPKATLLEALSRSLARVFSGGSTKELLLQLIETQDIRPSDLEIIKAAAAGQNPKTKKTRKS
jgi:predicted transcriptional regulator